MSSWPWPLLPAFNSLTKYSRFERHSALHSSAENHICIVYLHIHDIHKSTQYNFEIHEIGSPLTTSCTLGLTCRLYMFDDMKLIMTWSIFRINTLMSKFWHFFPRFTGSLRRRQVITSHANVIKSSQISLSHKVITNTVFISSVYLGPFVELYQGRS